MIERKLLCVVFALAFCVPSVAQDTTVDRPAELQVVKSWVGTWDASVEVWPQGLDSPSIKFTGVETNEAHGEYWIASTFVSQFNGQTMKVHSIVGYDLDAQSMKGTVVDHGPYAATMTGTYDKPSASVTWMTQAKSENGTPMVQKTVVTQKSADRRELVLMVPGGDDESFVKFMEIHFIKRKADGAN